MIHAIPLALLAAILLGSAMVTARHGLRHMHPTSGALVSIPSATLVFWVLSPALLDPGGFRLDAALVFALLGLIFPAAVTVLSFAANQRMGPTISSTIASTAPLVAVGSAIVFLGESPTAAAVAGTLAVVLGIMAISWQPRTGPARWPWWVLLIPLAGALFRGLAQMAVKLGFVLWPDPFAATLIGYTASTLVVAVAVVAWFRPRPLLHRSGVPWFVATGLLNGGGVLTMYVALRVGTVSVVSPIIATYPLFTLALSWLVLRDDRLSQRVVLGVLLTVAGVVLVVI